MPLMEYLKAFTILLLGILLFGATVHIIFFQHFNEGLLNSSGTGPVFGYIANRTAYPGDTIEFPVVAYDPRGSQLFYYADVPKGATFNQKTHTFRWVPAADQAGYWGVTFVVSNGQAMANETVVIRVKRFNTPPVFAPIGNRTVFEGSPVEIAVNATDPDGDNLTVTLDTLPPGGKYDAPNRTFRWTPAAGQEGNYDLVFVASDGEDYTLGRSLVMVRSPVTSLGAWLRELRNTLANAIGSIPLPGAPATRPGSSRVYRVEPNGSISDAIRDAQPGDIILVGNATYRENVIVDRAVSLVGNGSPVIDAGGTGSAVSITAAGASIDGFTLTNSGTCIYCAGLKISSNLETVRNCTIRDNQVGLLTVPPVRNSSIASNLVYNNTGDGISFDNAHDLSVEGNTVLNNGGAGIRILDSSFLQLRENDIEFNGGPGITATRAFRNTLAGNVLRWNGGAGLEMLSGMGSQVLFNRAEFNNGSGLAFDDSRDPFLLGYQLSVADAGTGNFLSSNLVRNNRGAGISLSQMTAVVANNTLAGNNEGADVRDSSVAILGNRGDGNGIGFLFVSADNSSVESNEVQGNFIGINLDGISNRNRIIGNTVTNNTGTGIALGPYTELNLVSDNTILFNMKDSLVDEGNNDRRLNIFAL